MKTAQIKLTIRLLLMLLMSLGIASSQWPFASSGSAAVTLNLKSGPQITSEANSYDTAIREISRIAALNLTTPEGSKTAQEILETHVPHLKFGRSKLIVLGLSDSSFVSAIKAKTFDTKSAQQFALELGQDATSIFKLSGASAIRDRISSSVAADISKLEKVARLLKEAAAKLSAESNLGTISATIVAPVTAISATLIAVVIAAAAVVAVPALGAALVGLATTVAGASATAGSAFGAASAAAIAGAAAVVAGVTAVASSEETQEKITACQDKADSHYRRCKSAANDLPWPANGVARDGCYADWLLEAAKCLVSD